MSNATFSRKPLVAAVLTTFAVFSAGAMAGDNEEPKTNVHLTVGAAESTENKTVAGTVQNEQTWDEAWAKKFVEDFKNSEGKVTINRGNGGDKITISKGTDDKTSGKLTNKLSSLTLNVGLDVNEGGTFVNNGTLEANKAITVTGSLVNTGTLKINNNLTINGLDKTTDLEAAPASVVMGDITLTNATLTNKDKGYKLKTEADKKEGEDDKTRVRVTYGKVTLNEGGNFFNNEGALDSGSSLTISRASRTLSGAMAKSPRCRRRTSGSPGRPIPSPLRPHWKGRRLRCASASRRPWRTSRVRPTETSATRSGSSTAPFSIRCPKIPRETSSSLSSRASFFERRPTFIRTFHKHLRRSLPTGFGLTEEEGTSLVPLQNPAFSSSCRRLNCAISSELGTCGPR